jgi:hypothetical protein
MNIPHALSMDNLYCLTLLVPDVLRYIYTTILAL